MRALGKLSAAAVLALGAITPAHAVIFTVESTGYATGTTITDVCHASYFSCTETVTPFGIGFDYIDTFDTDQGPGYTFFYGDGIGAKNGYPLWSYTISLVGVGADGIPQLVGSYYFYEKPNGFSTCGYTYFPPDDLCTTQTSFASTPTFNVTSTDRISYNGPFLPEPATWAMMLLGFGGIGFAMRRNRSGTLAEA